MHLGSQCDSHTTPAAVSWKPFGACPAEQLALLLEQEAEALQLLGLTASAQVMKPQQKLVVMLKLA